MSSFRQAIEAVLRADKKRMDALAREKELLAALDAEEDDKCVARLPTRTRREDDVHDACVRMRSSGWVGRWVGGWVFLLFG